jgi:hypothetical protein
MNDIVVQKASINPEALDADLRTAFGAAVSGISYSGGKVVVHMDDTATPTQVQQAQQIVGSHDASRLTAAQQAAVNRQQALAQLRETADAVTLRTTDFSGAQQGLAQKVMWLEQEVRELRQRLGGS